MTYDIADIYARYEVPPWLGLHMRRVTAVAVTVYDAQPKELRTNPADRITLIAACLLHDLGNIVKFDFDRMPAGTPEGDRDWREVQLRIVARYGSHDHAATHAMLDELGISQRILDIIDPIGFDFCDEIDRGSDLILKIVQYADSRVSPQGIVSLDARLSDMYERYARRHSRDSAESIRQEAALRRIEAELFSEASIRPDDITDATVAPLIVSLTHFDITAGTR